MKKAFTLIELIVMMGIVALFTSILFIDYGRNSKSFALDRSVRKMAQDIRRAQEMAMTGLIGDENTNGYGVFFDKTVGNNTSYIIYQNENANMYYESGTDSVKEAINIETGIKICNILLDSSDQNNISLSFEPPDPINYINSYYTGHEAFVVLCIDGDETKTKTVKVNNAGRIEVTSP
jgi:type II secretory pathway pseudopilin PulG